MLHQIQAVNQQLFLALNSLSENTVIRDISIIFADAPIFFLPLFLVAGWIYFAQKKNTKTKESLLAIFYSTAVTVIFNMIIQHLVFVERPATFLGAKAHFVLNHIPDASFPSDHAAVGFAFVLSAYLFGFQKIAYYFLPFFLLMAVSRVIAGVHWPLDIVGGVFVGALAT